MPELPDLEVYKEALERHVVDHSIEKVVVRSPFVVRTVSPSIFAVQGIQVTGVKRIGKMVVLSFDNAIHLVIHLMIAGRFRWRQPGTGPKNRNDLISLQFSHGTLLLTEAGTKKRASLHVVADEDQLRQYDPGGIDVLECSTRPLKLCCVLRTIH